MSLSRSLTLVLVLLTLSSSLCELLGESGAVVAASTFPAPVYLKFHKVGSATVNTVLRAAFTSTPYWSCSDHPFSHDMLRHYIQRRGNLSSCIKPINASLPVTLPIAVLRHPLERIISQITFFGKELKDQLLQTLIENNNTKTKTNPKPKNKSGDVVKANVSHISNVLLTASKIRQQPEQVNVSEVVALLDTVDSHRNLLNANLEVREYQKTFAGYISESSQPARDDMREHIAIIGVTEQMPSFMLLLSRRLNIPLELSCGIHDRHGAQPRKPVHESFRPEVIDAINTWARNEVELWEYAKVLHVEQLGRLGMTVSSATEEYDSVCSAEAARKKKKKEEERQERLKGK
jgi:hypothetical protein